jgi:hypothetical protein
MKGRTMTTIVSGSSLTRAIAGSAILALTACAPDGAGESEEQRSAEDRLHKPGTLNTEFPAGARIVEVDKSLSLEEALDVLADQGSDKGSYPVSCLGTRYAIQSVATGDYVTVDLQDYNILKARAAVIDEWEDFRICTTPPNWPSYLFLWSVAAGKYVVAQFNYLTGAFGQLRAGSSVPAEWEKMTRGQYTWGWTMGFVHSPHDYSSGPQYLVAGEFHYSQNSYGMLRARTVPTSWDPEEDTWELWNFVIH